MLSLKTTTTLIAAVSVIATFAVASALTTQAFTSQAFAQSQNNNTVNAVQSNSVKKDVDQNIKQDADARSGDKGTTIVAQDASQGFCEQINQANAANAGGSSSQGQSQIDTGTANASSTFGDVTGKDCS